MNRRRALPALLALGLLAAAPLPGQRAATPPAAARDSLAVLFIGNSYTYFNNVPRLVQGLAEGDHGAPRIAIAMAARGGMSLAQHLARADTRTLLSARRWDVVVVQEQSMLDNWVERDGDVFPGTPEKFHRSMRTLDPVIEGTGAHVLLYQTWARENQPQHTGTIADAYDAVARELDDALAPVGRAFAIARAERPSLALTIADRSHPTAAGSYLAACVLYGVLTGRPVRALPARIVGPTMTEEGTPGGPGPLVDLPAADARTLQEIAARAIERFARPLPPR